jgi:hypothetical protein
MSLRRLRVGELLALAGSGCVVASLLLPWYESAIGQLDVWDTFGPGIVLILTALCAALAMVLSALTERSMALPVATAVWCVPLGLMAVIAAAVRVLERPDHATSLRAGSWLALVGSALILIGAWLALRDERPSMYSPAAPEPRPRPQR